jgi:hypothetical protein
VHGIRRIEGSILVDASLFREARDTGGGVEITVSPMMINDNLVDVTVTPGRREGEPAKLHISPEPANAQCLVGAGYRCMVCRRQHLSVLVSEDEDFGLSTQMYQPGSREILVKIASFIESRGHTVLRTNLS